MTVMERFWNIPCRGCWTGSGLDRGGEPVKAKTSIGKLIYVPTLNNCNDLLVVTE